MNQLTLYFNSYALLKLSKDIEDPLVFQVPITGEADTFQFYLFDLPSYGFNKAISLTLYEFNFP